MSAGGELGDFHAPGYVRCLRQNQGVTPAAPTASGASAVVVACTRGKSKAANWLRPEQVAVIPLELDLSSDPVMRRRLGKHWDAVFGLRRALQHDAGAACRAYLAASDERAVTGVKTVRGRLGLNRKAVEERAKVHVERAGWMRHHFTKAAALHVTDEVWESADRFLFWDSTGKRHGMPRVGSWWDFTRIPGRARSHTKPQPVWETYRLVGSLQGHLDRFGGGLIVAKAAALDSGRNVLAQPKHLRAPARADRSWWEYDGPLAVVYTGLPGGDLVLPVRLPQGSGQFERLAHFLHDPSAWHKIDLCRVRDRRAPGGWRYQAHLTILGAGWAGHATAEMRALAPTARIGGVDGNVSNIAVASIERASAEPSLLTSHVTAAGAQREATVREAKKARDRMRALDRSRRASNTSQYGLSKKQRARAERRHAAGLPQPTVDVPRGARAAHSRGIPKRAYRRDSLSRAYRDLRADHAAAASATVRRKDAFARQTAQAIVAAHGPNLVTEDVNIRTWALRWGRATAAFTPGRMLAHLADECIAAGGALLRASTFTTALSQHCTCGTRTKKNLSRRWHACPCGVEGDRDLMSAAMASTVVLTEPEDPRTATIDHALRERLHATVLAGRTQDFPVTAQFSGQETAQQEGPVRSTIHHNPAATSGTGEDGSLSDGASAGQGECPALPRNRSHGYPRGRRRHRRTSKHPTVQQSTQADL